MQNQSKILLAVDGSDISLNAVHHIGRLFSKRQKIVLFHVKPDVPEAFKDLKGEKFINEQQFPLETWQAQQGTLILDFMEKARAALNDDGFEPKAVSVKVKGLKSGIARDIHNESLGGYAALVVGRAGLSNVEDITMGSVTSKLVEVTGHIPIIVVGTHPDSKKILMALDGSRGSMRAVKFVGAVIDPDACELMLCHVVRPLKIQYLNARERFVSKHEKEWIAANQRKIVPFFVEAKKQLVHAGVPEKKLSTEVLTYESSRAGAIVKAAEAGGCDTIAMGKRGFTSVKAFKTGRVCRKILHFAFRPALWIVS